MHRTLTSTQAKVSWGKSIPFLLVHLLPLGLFWTGARAIDWIVCGALYFVRMFFITGVYHRYFSHRSYKMGRVMQFLIDRKSTRLNSSHSQISYAVFCLKK